MSNTKEQNAAIHAPVQNLLVTAAAGAGKTYVLTERILRRITDPENGTDVDRLLIITFTRAAAAEMRERIGSAIARRLEASENDARLRRQYALLPGASISTMDAFCINLVRAWFFKADIDPGFTVIDSAEEEILCREALDECIEEALLEGDAGFLAFLDAYGGMRHIHNAEDMILDIHRFLEVIPLPDQWRKDALSYYENERFCETKAFKCFIMPEIKSRVDKILDALRTGLSYTEESTSVQECLKGDFEDFLPLLQETDWDTLYTFFHTYQFKRLPSTTQSPFSDEIKRCRQQAKDIFNQLKKTFPVLECEIDEQLHSMREVVSAMLAFEERFGARFFAKKKERGRFSFSDIERLALTILTTPHDGELVPSDAAREIRKQYNEIYIDEYQDTNSMQEAIFSAISGDEDRKPNTFRVGDLKQSIYRFRRTNPRLFAEKKVRYTEDGEYERKIAMSHNFRSRPQVLYAINDVFCSVMSPTLGDVDYRALEEQLCPPEVSVYDDEAHHHEKEEMLFTLISDSQDMLRAEATTIGKKILELMDDPTFFVYDKEERKNRRPKYRDFAVLFRTAKNVIPVFQEVLEEMGIPVYWETPTAFYENYEVLVMLSLMRLLDNPLQDIPLVGVLCSPLYRVSADTLAAIREANETTPYYIALTQYVEQLSKKESLTEQEVGEIETLGRFLTQLEHWRSLARILPLRELCELLIAETGWNTYVSALPGGGARLHNLESLKNRAAQFENTSSKGLFYFLQFVEKTQKSRKPDIDGVMDMSELDAPRLLSIHKSKGLEYPVVFIARAHEPFNMRDTSGTMILSEEMGVGLKQVDVKNRLKRETLLKKAISYEIASETLSEEMRVLYVAMTRAREKLYVSACLTENAYTEQYSLWESGIPEPSSSKSFLSWVAPNALTSLYWQISAVRYQEIEPTLSEQTVYMPESCPPSPAVLAHFGFTYPYAAATQVPTKFTVTELKHFYDDRDDAPGDSSIQSPVFLQETKKDFTNAEKGSIIHLILELIDFHRTNSVEAVRAQIEEMVAKGHLLPRQADAADLSLLMPFFESPLCARMKNAPVLYREVPFTFLKRFDEIDPSYQGEDTTMIQGVIDCWFMEDGYPVLIDYKTDAATSPKFLIERYQTQIALYEEALWHMTGQFPRQSYIYALSLKRAIEVERKTEHE